MMLLTLAQDVAADAPNEAYLLWGFILFGAAVLLLGLEFFVPSGGMIAILCGVAAVGSVVAFFQYSTTLGIVVALGYVVLTPFALVFIFKLWLNSPIAKLMILDDTNKVFVRKGAPCVAKLVRWVHPVEAICTEAVDGKYDLVVLGRRGLAEAKRGLLGSVSEGVLRSSPCAVLMVK